MGVRHGCSSLGIVPGGTEIDEYPDFAVEETGDDDDDDPPRILARAVGPMPWLLRNSEKETESIEQMMNKANDDEEEYLLMNLIADEQQVPVKVCRKRDGRK